MLLHTELLSEGVLPCQLHSCGCKVVTAVNKKYARPPSQWTGEYINKLIANHTRQQKVPCVTPTHNTRCSHSHGMTPTLLHLYHWQESNHNILISKANCQSINKANIYTGFFCCSTLSPASKRSYERFESQMPDNFILFYVTTDISNTLHSWITLCSIFISSTRGYLQVRLWID